MILLQPGPDDPDALRGTGALEACLIHLTALLDHPVTAVDIDRARSGDNPALTSQEAIDAASAAGLQGAFGAMPLARLTPTLLPAILYLKQGRAVVLLSREHGQAKIYDPAFATALTVSEDHLTADHTGHVLVLRPMARDEDRLETYQAHWFWSSLRRESWSWTQVILAASTANILGLTTSLFIMVVYDRVLPNAAIDSLIALTIGVAIALVFDFLIRSLRAGFIDHAGQRADLAMGRIIFDHLLTLRPGPRRTDTGAMASTLREFESLREFFTSASLVALVDLPFICLFVAVIWLIAGPLAVVPLIALPLVLGLCLGVQPQLARLADRSLAAGQSKQGVLVETLTGLETIRAIGAAGRMRARWQAAQKRQSDHGLKSQAITQFALHATAFAQQAAQVAIVVYGVFLIAAGSVSMGALIAAVILTGRALAPLAQLAQTLMRLNHARSSYRALDRLMQTPGEDSPDTDTGQRRWLDRPALTGRISLRNVSFAYPGSTRDVLHDLSLEIAPGEHIAVLGRIGSGKSTLTRLILGLQVPRAGAVLVDGTDIRQIAPAALRSQIGVVLQDVWLSSGSLRDAITMGKPRATDAAIIAAARLAGVDTFAALHPAGYDLLLGERGEGLSGGQKQAVALARALLGQPRILLLDEPTSAMDGQTEAQVIANLRAECVGRTLIVISHRPSILSLVDRVIVIEDGRIVADGPKGLLGQPAMPRADIGQVRSA